MQFSKRLALFTGVLAVAGACSQSGSEQAGEAEQQALASAEIAEIPVTTVSEEAMVDFTEGRELADVGRPQEANTKFRSAVEKDPTFAFAYLNIANNATSGEEFNSNVAHAVENMGTASDGERMLIEVAAAFTDNDADRALEISRQLTEAYPNSPRAWVNLGNVLGGRGPADVAASREAYMKAVELDPGMFAANAALGFSYLFTDPRDFAKAKEYMENLTELDPEEAKGYENLGDVYRAMSELETARESYSMALEKDPTLSVAALKKGHINSFLGNFEEARADYDQGVGEAKAENKGFYGVYRAFVPLHEGNPEGSIAELVMVSETAKDLGVREDQVYAIQTFALGQAAQIALHHDMFEKAKEVLAAREAVQLANIELVGDPDFTRAQQANILLFQGQLAAREGDYETAAAKAAEQRALIENDTNPARFQGTHALLGLISLEQGNYQEAVQHLREANLNNIYNKYLLALAEEGAGNTAEAQQLFNDVANFNFNSVGFALVGRDAMEKATTAT